VVRRKIKLTTKVTQEYEAKFIRIDTYVRRWDAATINGVSDEKGDLTPFRKGNLWQPIIDIENGSVVNWPVGMVANFYFKVVDTGCYHLLDEHKNVLASINNYVPLPW
jgi:hypothetical protein